MANAKTLAERLSDWYDKHKPDVKTIKVNLTRASCMKWARPLERGGSLYFRGREILHKPKKQPGQ